MIDLLNFSLADIIDILLVGVLIYQIYRLIKGTAALNIFIGIIIIYLAWFVVNALNMRLLSAITGQVLSVGVIALIVIFQQEIRRFLIHLGSDASDTEILQRQYSGTRAIKFLWRFWRRLPKPAERCRRQRPEPLL